MREAWVKWEKNVDLEVAPGTETPLPHSHLELEELPYSFSSPMG